MKNVTPEMVSARLSQKEIKAVYGLSHQTVAKYRKLFGICIRSKRAKRWVQVERHTPCPRCGSVAWKVIAKDTMYCRSATDDIFGKCFYHKVKDPKS